MTLSRLQAQMPSITHPESDSCTHLSVPTTQSLLAASPLCSFPSPRFSYSTLTRSSPSNLSSLTFPV